MGIALSTSYFAGRGLSPAEMAAQTRALGFESVELGYFTRDIELAAWEDALAKEGLTVTSLHSFCPMPISMPQMGPEAFSLADPDPAERRAAVEAMLRTLDCAVRFGASAIVNHGGRVSMHTRGGFFSRGVPYRSQLSKALARPPHVPDRALAEYEFGLREQAAPAWIDGVSESLEVLLPRFEAAGRVLAFENLPGLEAFPDPAEMTLLRRRFPSPALGAWYDIGHGERKARVGDWPVAETLELTADFTVGMHIHDVRGLEEDHCAPGEGSVDYEALRPLMTKPGILHIFEPAPSVEPGPLAAGLVMLRERGLLQAAGTSSAPLYD